MDSTINLLPEKDKQLKREGQHKQPAEMVEMTKPQDRVFQERVVRLEGLLAFFKSIFRRAPKLPQPKVIMVSHPAPPKPVPTAPKPAAPVTKLETMLDRIPSVPLAPKPAVTLSAGNFFTKLFSKPKKHIPFVGLRPAPGVPPPPRPKATTLVPGTVRKAPSWAPSAKPIVAPLPRPTALAAVKAGAASPPLAPAPPLSPLAFPPPLRNHPAPPAAQSTEAQPLPSRSLNVNLVPEQYQPEASGRDRLLAGSFVGGAVVLVAAAALGLYFYQQRLQSKVEAVDQQTLQVNQEITSRERDDLTDALVLQQRTSDVKRVLNQHVYWDAFFKKLEGLTLPTVAYSTMSVDVAGSVTLAAQARTYNDVGAQLLTYQRAKDFITDATISGATRASTPVGSPQADTPPGQTAPVNQSPVLFSVSLRVDPAIFYRR